MKAVWNGAVLAESDDTIVVEGNYYFPPDSLKREFFAEGGLHTVCFWKGKASYSDVEVDGKVNKDTAWYYPSPSPVAKKIADYVAFWRCVKIAA